MALTAGRVFLLLSLGKTIPGDTLEMRVQWPREADAALDETLEPAFHVPDLSKAQFSLL